MVPRLLGAALSAVLVAGLLSAPAAVPAVPAVSAPDRGASSVEPPVAAGGAPGGAVDDARRRRPLRGVRIVLDPGHQLGNRNFPRQINRPVDAGGLTKPCNTTGTATNGGYPEATFNFSVARLTARRLRRLGATVRLTRTTNRADRWGPCIDERGRAGNAAPRADLKVSIHADGNLRAGARGFHVIAPLDRAPTAGIHADSRRLAVAMRRPLRRVLPTANYIGRDGLDFRGDLGTLNLSRVPVVLVELGNMRHPADAALMTRKQGRRAYARALVRGARGFLER